MSEWWSEGTRNKQAAKMRVIVPLQGVLHGRLGIFFGSLIPCALFYFMQLRLRRSRQSQSQAASHADPAAAPLQDGQAQEASAPVATDVAVAGRALKLLQVDPDVAAYYDGWVEAAGNAFHPQRNPGGCIQLGLSENNVSE